MKKIILIDGNGLIFRAFYATATRMTMSPNGVPTNAIYLLSSIILRLLEKREFDEILVALDAPGKKFRHQEYQDYKANRKALPPELKAQFEPIKEFLNICNIKTIEIEGYEADDIIGTLSVNAKNHNVDLEVYTGDRDLLQLINDNTVINMMHKGLSEVEPFTKEHMLEVYGINPKQIIDLKALMGDTSDNIPGVKGVGEKTAFDLIKTYGTLDSIYEHIDEIKGKLKEKLEQDKEMAYLSYKLATIETDVNVDLEVLDGNYTDIDKVKLTEFLMKYNIKSLLKYGETLNTEKEKFIVETNIVEKVSKDLLNENSLIYIDIDNDNYHYGEIEGLAIANKDKCEYIPFTYLSFDFDLIDYLENKNIKKNVFDGKKIYVALNKIGYKLENISFDFILACYLLNQDFQSIEDLLESYDISINKIDLKKASLNERASYAQTIAKASITLKEKVLDKIKEIENTDLLYKVEQPLSLILAKMEINGALIDNKLLKELDNEYTSRLLKIEKEIANYAGTNFNVNSPKQLAEYLYDTLGLPCNKKRTTTADDLNNIKELHPVVSLILEHRKYSKLLNTYIDAFTSYQFADGRIHTMFNQSSTMTGRLSSSQPNMQNLSVRDDDRSIIRKLIIAPDGYKLLSLDYSQIELRILAILANDKNMIETFNNGIDIHKACASKIFNVPVENVTSEQRRIAKATNFGIVYGISSWGLAEQTGLSFERAKEIIDLFFSNYPSIKDYLDKSVEFCEDKGYIVTLMKRRRVVPEIKSPNYNIKSFGKRVAMNTPIQGSAADLIKVAMIKVDNLINEKYKDCCKMTLQIHDELLFEVKEEMAEDIKNDIKNIMENVLVNMPIKFEVDGAIGNNWLESK